MSIRWYPGEPCDLRHDETALVEKEDICYRDRGYCFSCTGAKSHEDTAGEKPVIVFLEYEPQRTGEVNGIAGDLLRVNVPCYIHTLRLFRVGSVAQPGRDFKERLFRGESIYSANMLVAF
jgi:hypothetical protein